MSFFTKFYVTVIEDNLQAVHSHGMGNDTVSKKVTCLHVDSDPVVHGFKNGVRSRVFPPFVPGDDDEDDDDEQQDDRCQNSYH